MSSPNLPPRRDRSPSVSRNTQSRRHVRASKPPVSPQSLLVEDETKPFISVSPSGEFSGSGTDPTKPATSGQEVMRSESSLSSTASSQFNLPAATVTSSGNFDPGFEPPDDVGNKCNSHARTSSSSEEGRRPAISVSSNSPAASRSHRDSTIVVPPTLPVAAPPSSLTATAKVDIIAASPNTPSFTSANVFGRIKRIIDAKRKFMDTRSRRFDRLMAQLPFDANGKVEAVAACRVFLACGVTMPSSLANPLAAQSLSRDDVVKLLEGKEEEIAGMEHLDNIGDDLGDDERNTVAASRIVISSRISAFARKTRTSGWLLHQALDILHYVSMLFHFIVVSLYCVVYLDREPKQLYGVLWGIWALWVLDIVWTLHSPVTDANGKVVDSPWLIAWEKRFILSLDVLCVLPMDMILYPMCESKSQFNPFDSSHRILAAFLILRYLKLAKPIRILWLFQFEKLDVITPTFVTFFFLIKPMLRILAVVIITIQTLVVIDYIVHQGALTDVYLDNLVDIMSMVSGAGINVAFEGPSGTVFEIFLMCCGLIAQAAVISNLSVTVFRNDVNALNVQQMRETLSILEHFSVPADVSTEILSYQLHALSDDVSVRLATLDTLPAKMQKEVMLYVKVAAVNTVKLFSKATHDCKMKIADSLIQTVVAPNTDIVAIGDIGEEMFLIAHGYASVIIFNGVTVAMLSRGDYFGEVALLLPNNVRQATVRALTYCDLWVLDKPAFLFILQEFPGLLVSMEDDLKAKGIKIDPLELLAKKPPEGGEPGPMSPPHSSSNPIGSSPFEDDLRRVSAVNPMHHGLITSHQALRVTDEDDEDTTPIFDAPPPNATAFNSTRGLEPSMFEQSVNYMNHTFTGHGRHRKSRASILTISGGGVASRAVPFPASSFLQSPSGGDHLTRLHGQLSSMESFSPVTSQISNQMVVHPSSVRRSMSPPSPSRLEEQHRSREASSQIASFALGGSGVGVTVGGGESTNALQNRIQALELELWNLARDVQDLVGKV